jgi:hypothetical protein
MSLDRALDFLFFVSSVSLVLISIHEQCLRLGRWVFFSDLLASHAPARSQLVCMYVPTVETTRGYHNNTDAYRYSEGL